MQLQLLYTLTRFELRERHRGQSIGALWAFIYPLVIMSAYGVIFTRVFPARLGDGADGGSYTMSVLGGLLAWLPLQDALNRSASSFVGSGQVLLREKFSSVTLAPARVVVATYVSYLPALLVVWIWSINSTSGWLPWLLPLAYLSLVPFSLGLSYLIAVSSLALRDIQEVIRVVTALGLFVTPVIYNPASTPSVLQTALYVNPGSYPVWAMQFFAYGPTPHSVWGIILFPILSAASLFLGYRVVTKASLFVAGQL